MIRTMPTISVTCSFLACPPAAQPRHRVPRCLPELSCSQPSERLWRRVHELQINIISFLDGSLRLNACPAHRVHMAGSLGVARDLQAMCLPLAPVAVISEELHLLVDFNCSPVRTCPRPSVQHTLPPLTPVMPTPKHILQNKGATQRQSSRQHRRMRQARRRPQLHSTLTNSWRRSSRTRSLRH